RGLKNIARSGILPSTSSAACDLTPLARQHPALHDGTLHTSQTGSEGCQAPEPLARGGAHAWLHAPYTQGAPGVNSVVSPTSPLAYNPHAPPGGQDTPDAGACLGVSWGCSPPWRSVALPTGPMTS